MIHRIPDRKKGLKPHELVRDDEAGTMSGDRSDAPEAVARRAPQRPPAVSAEGISLI